MTDTYQHLLDSIPFMVGSIFLLAALLDFLYYRLPNKLFYVIFYLFPIYILLSFKFHLFSNYLVFVGSILIGFTLFSAAIIGGGDAKLLAAVSLWIGWNNLVPFLLWMLIFGGIVSCAYLIFPSAIHHITAKWRTFIQKSSFLKKGIQFFVSDMDRIEGEVVSLQQKRMIPYGISIAGAGLIIILKGMM
ncbi:MAG: prepilin peptidase [Alphaproteobacteria bacterium]|jgi:prepilin peptidase CpaA|nr:prepilin peptidase [Alphaproteobacteria bacterium]